MDEKSNLAYLLHKELLTCEKYKVEEALNYCDELDSISGSHNMRNWGKQMIVYLFGSKCLLDAHEDNFATKKPEPAEPKFNLGDKAILKGYVCTITSIVYEQGKFVGYKIESPLLHGIATVPESDLEPYTEPVGTKDDTKGNTKDPTFTDDCKSQCKSPDRLRIAAMAMGGILSKGELADPDEVTDMALIYADELIEKCEKGKGDV